MPWNEVSTVSLRTEFVMMAQAEGANMAELCRHFGVSRKTGYKWLKRFAEQGTAGLENRSRRPQHSPSRTAPATEAKVTSLRRKHPAWGGRKLRKRLQVLGCAQVPGASTITDILHRHGLIEAEESAKHTPWQRFEHTAPNRLWQMDFKGHLALMQGRCHALTVLDDYSRFNVGLQACADEQGITVHRRLSGMFDRYGIPEAMLMDNGSPWGSDQEHPYTPLTVWLIRLGIRVIHSRPYHPQTQGKDERFHRTFGAEVLRGRLFKDLPHCQRHFDRWRDIYNLERPHEALGMEVPASRYQPSARPLPSQLAPIDYGPGETVRKVQDHGQIFFRGQVFRIAKAFRGYPVALRPLPQEGKFDVYFCHQKVSEIDLRASGSS